jgi:hypothetical protein
VAISKEEVVAIGPFQRPETCSSTTCQLERGQRTWIPTGPYGARTQSATVHCIKICALFLQKSPIFYQIPLRRSLQLF